MVIQRAFDSSASEDRANMPTSDILIGTRIGGFTILDRLGAGGMGTVYKARQESMDRDVALKIIIPGAYTELDDFGARFEREAKLCAALNHPHIIKVFDYSKNEAGGRAYLAMEMHSGGSLARVISGRPLPIEKVLRLAEQVASALDYAHARNIVHRDLKPENVLLDESGNAILSDFGLAKLSKATTALTQQGIILGTWAYVAPEQWRGLDLDPRADIYAFGIMLYEMLTGHVPYQGATTEALIHQHLHEWPKPVSSQRFDLPAAVDSVLIRTLAKDPTDRYQSSTEVIQAFRAALVGPDKQVPGGSADVIVPIARAPLNLRAAPAIGQIGLIRTSANKLDRVAFDYNDTFIATAGTLITQAPLGLQRTASIQLWDAIAYTEEGTLPTSDLSVITNLCFSPDSRYLAAAGYFETVRIGRDARGREVEELIRLGSLNVWDVPYRKLLWYVLSERKNSVFGCAFDRDQRLILSDSADGVYLYQADQPTELSRLSARKGSVFVFEGFQRFGLVEDTTHRLVLWDQHGEQPLFTLPTGETNLADAALAPDGVRLAVCARMPANALVCWTMSGQRLWKTAQYEQGVWSTAFAADSSLLCAGLGSGQVKLYDAANGQEKVTLKGHAASVNGLSFHPDGGLLASASSDGTARIWGILDSPTEQVPRESRLSAL
jgi:serine/threonine-protein kinase